MLQSKFIYNITNEAVANHDQDFSECYEMFIENYNSNRYFIVVPTETNNVYKDCFGTIYNGNKTEIVAKYNHKQFNYNKYINVVDTSIYRTITNIKVNFTNKVKKIVFINQAPLSLEKLSNVVLNLKPSEWTLTDNIYVRN